VDVAVVKFAMIAGPRIEYYQNVEGLVFAANFDKIRVKSE
jgi:hypothetical protein